MIQSLNVLFIISLGFLLGSSKEVSSQMWFSTCRISTQNEKVRFLLKLHFQYTFSTNDCCEVPIRMAYFWVASYLTGIVSAFIGTGLLRLRGVHGLAGWRYLFLIEGCLTLVVGLASFFLMPAGPTQTKAWYRPNGWFTDR